MGAKSKISWTGSTWNYLRGCSREMAEGATQSGCGDPTGGGCYAERDGRRFCGPGLPYEGLVRITPKGARWTGKVSIIAEHLLDPLRWQTPRKVFVASVSDPFHHKLSNEEIAAGFGVMALADWHTFQSLTKRARRMPEWFGWIEERARRLQVSVAGACIALARELVAKLIPRQLSYFDKAHEKAQKRAVRWPIAWPLPNVWLGVSAEHQLAWDERVPPLLECPAVVRMVSVEPMIGPVVPDVRHIVGAGAVASYRRAGGRRDQPLPSHLQPPPFVSWVIVGCESGPRSRLCHTAWVRALRDLCQRYGVAFFAKQLVREGLGNAVSDGSGSFPKGRGFENGTIIEMPYLDGAQHIAFPEPW